MKRSLIVVIMMFYSCLASAQGSYIYGDAGISLARFKPGASVTFNYNVLRFLGFGIGFQAYDFHATMTNFQYVPAVYGELRLNIRPRKDNQFFAFMDIGANLYTHNDDLWQDRNFVYKVHSNNGTYGGLGIGYFRRLPKRSWGPYGSLKLISNSYKADSRDLTTSKQGTAGWGDATLVISAGFRF
ncbi:MAG: hypothetical protein H0X33_11405 [Taibaiella sp.]|nr:hypothetical protein [Taibaiella sp.]